MKDKLSELYESITSFFPIQLLINNIKKNQILLFFWFLLFATILEKFGTTLGVPFLFLDPEYLNEVSFSSMAIVGICFGIFTISYFITSYILDSHRFPFLIVIKNPFINFCLNNSILPISFLIVYISKFISFQFESGFGHYSNIFLLSLYFIGGFILTILFFFTYFHFTNKQNVRDLVENFDDKLKKRRINTVQVLKKISNVKKQKPSTLSYLYMGILLKKVDTEQEIDKRELFKIIDQHHLNAVSVEILVFVCILITGIFQDFPFFQIPAAASGFLLLSFFIMFTGAFSYWLRGWAITGIIAIFVLINTLIKYEVINSNNPAYGISYDSTTVNYTLENIRDLTNPDTVKADIYNTQLILDKWRAKFPADKKPKMIFLCASGGGQRSATWTLNTLQYVDKAIGGKLLSHNVLMTGASGGLIGLAFFRELYHKKLEDSTFNLYSDEHIQKISKDILNPIIFSMVINDMFLRFQRVKIGPYVYFKDRGYAFERQLNYNTEYLLEKELIDYRSLEQNAIIPMMIVAPTIINDARKLYISPIGISYMNKYNNKPDHYQERIKGVEFRRLFKNAGSDHLSVLSALRMSATFPYVTPNVTLPSSPKMEIMDAGLSDNYGIRDALHFMHTFNYWISENTSGVIVVSIRDTKKYPEIKQSQPQSFFNKIFNPIGGLVKNWDNNQDFSNDNAIEFAQDFMTVPFEVLSFEYDPKPKNWDLLKHKKIDPNKIEEQIQKERASLSWHLTKREKESIKRTIFEEKNQKTLQKLIDLLEE